MNYYIYQHIRLDTNEIFYIGKGTKKLKGNAYHRAYTKSSRNKYWLNIINQTSYKVEILGEFETEKECLIKETELIILYGFSWNNTGSLCNMVKDNDDIRILARDSATKNNCKKVYQYSLEGDYIKCFDSIVEAKNIYNCDIYNACSQRVPSAGGFQWRTVKYDKLNPYSKEVSQISKSKKVYQYSLDDQFIKEWNGTKEPSRELNINRTSIRNCLSKLSKTAGKYKWTYVLCEACHNVKTQNERK